jgi:hypothetical protein
LTRNSGSPTQTTLKCRCAGIQYTTHTQILRDRCRARTQASTRTQTRRHTLLHATLGRRHRRH